MKTIMNKTNEAEEFESALRGLRDKLHESIRISNDARDKLKDLMADGGLRSTLTWLHTDIEFRKKIEWLITYKKS